MSLQWVAMTAAKRLPPPEPPVLRLLERPLRPRVPRAPDPVRQGLWQRWTEAWRRPR